MTDTHRVARACSQAAVLPKDRSRGFSLVEVMMTVVVIGIVVSIAMPTYIKTSEDQRRTRATSMLRAIRNAQETHFLRARAYTTNWGDLDIAQPNTGDFNYQLLSASPTGFTVRATRISNSNCAMTIDEFGTLSGCGLVVASSTTSTSSSSGGYTSGGSTSGGVGGGPTADPGGGVGGGTDTTQQ
ncbi:MAG TPA: prepilin-type N-terminal cleavage/methylation domain-containing protein [bacterium]